MGKSWEECGHRDRGKSYVFLEFCKANRPKNEKTFTTLALFFSSMKYVGVDMCRS